MMSCWPAPGWDWLNAALVAAPATTTASISGIRSGTGHGQNSAGDEARAEVAGGACTFNLTNFDWYAFGFAHFAEHDKELIGGPQSGSGGVTGRTRLRRFVSVERAMSYSRQAARTRLNSLRQLLLPKMDDESCGYVSGYGPSRRVTNVAWHLRTGDLCDANRTMQAHFDEAFDQMQRLSGPRSAAAAFAHHIFTEVTEAPTTDMTARSFICLGTRLRVRACLNASSGACTVYSASLDGARAGPLSRVRVLVNGEPFATLACMAAADRSVYIPMPTHEPTHALRPPPRHVPRPCARSQCACRTIRTLSETTHDVCLSQSAWRFPLRFRISQSRSRQEPLPLATSGGSGA